LLDPKFTSFPSAQFLYPQTAAQGGGDLSVEGSATGNQLPYTSEVSATLSANYAVPTSHGTFALNAEYAYESPWYSGPDNILRSPISNLINAQLSWTLPGDHTRIAFWGRNLNNQAVPSILVEQANPGGFSAETMNPPRTFGITVQYQF
jgi:outer membrane receptor protein involved in Fe transport